MGLQITCRRYEHSVKQAITIRLASNMDVSQMPITKLSTQIKTVSKFKNIVLGHRAKPDNLFL